MTRRRSAAKARRRPTTAIARRPQSAPPAAAPEASAPQETDLQVLGDEAALGALGLVEITLTPKEERVLSRPVDESRVCVKPTGQVYLPHAEYTRWFNAAFGRLGWVLVPKAKPLSNGVNVIVPYVLYIHGKPAAFAYGEQDYHEGNREQTYGDVAEATVASALRRCAKRLGVGLELWDRAWGHEWTRTHAVCVPVLVSRKGADGAWTKKRAFQWRRRIDPPFPTEVQGDGRTAEGDEYHPREFAGAEPERPQKRPVREERPAGHHSHAAEVVTEAQLRRLYVIVRNSGRSDEVVKAWLKVRFGLESSKDIKRQDYEFIVRCIEADGPLPLSGQS